MLKRLCRLLRSRNTHLDVDDELRFHLEKQTEANIASGLPPGEARRQALITFGGVERTRESCREQRPGFQFETLLQDLRYAIRGFRRSPIFTLTIVITLTLGIGATTAVFSVVDRLLFRPLPYAHPDRIVSLGLVQSLETQEFMVGSFYFDWRTRQQPFVSFAAEQAAADACDLTERNPAQLRCSSMEAGFLPMLGVTPLLGRNFLPEEDRPHGPAVALITYSLWRSRYNSDPGVLKKSIEIDGRSVQVVGVLPKDFELPSLHAADVIFPRALDEAAERKSSLGSPMRVFARLKPGVSLDQARAQLEPLFQSAVTIIPTEIRKDFHLKVRSLRDRQMQEIRPIAWVLFGTVIVVLLIACANVTSLLLARGATRMRELAVRSALGASRSRLACQAITESLLLSLTGAVGGCLFAELLLRVFLAIAPAGIPYLSQMRLDPRIIGFAILLSLVCGLIFGIAPAMRRPDGAALSARSIQHGPSIGIRQSLVIAQLAASVLLLAGAMLLLRSFWNLERQQLGLNTESTLTLGVTLGPHAYATGQQRFAFFQQLTDRLRFGPGVSLVAVADSLPPAPGHNQRRFSSIGVAGAPPSASDAGGKVTYRWVSPDYLRALEIPILQGEGFTEEELGSTDHFVVLSKTLASRLFPGKNPLGERLQLDRATSSGVGDIVAKDSQALSLYKVVGVAADVKNAGLAGEDIPEYYRLRRSYPDDWQQAGAWGGSALLVIRSSLPPASLSTWARAQVAAIDPTLPVDVITLKERVSKLADVQRFQTLLVSFFAATGLILTMVGLYGIISFLVAQRTHEIGIRMALGASRDRILYLILGRSFRLIVAGISLGLVAALLTCRLLASLLFSISPYDIVTFVVVPLLLIVVAIAATLIPARFATKVDPIEALRCD